MTACQLEKAGSSGSVDRSIHFAAALACSEPVNAPVRSEPELRLARPSASAGPSVTSTLPSEAPRDTTLDVQVNGKGFDNGSKVSLQLNGVTDSGVRVNNTRYVKATQLVANVTIAADAITDFYDVVVVTSTGKKGIGTEGFLVTLQAELLVGGTFAKGVNESGVAVGTARNPSTCSLGALPILWRLDGTAEMLPLGVNCGAIANGINASGVVLRGTHRPLRRRPSALSS